MKKNKNSFWISPSGKIIQAKKEDCAEIAEIFRIPYEEKNCVLYYRIGIENGYVRVLREEDNIKIFSPKEVKEKQARKLNKMLSHKNSFISFLKEKFCKIFKIGL